MMMDYQPVMVKNKLLCIIHKIENKEIRNNDIINLLGKFTSHVLPMCQGNFWPKEDLDYMEHEIFMADVFICVNLRNQSIDSLRNVIKRIDKRIIGQLLLQKRLYAIADDDHIGDFANLCVGQRHTIAIML